MTKFKLKGTPAHTYVPNAPLSNPNAQPPSPELTKHWTEDAVIADWDAVEEFINTHCDELDICAEGSLLDNYIYFLKPTAQKMTGYKLVIMLEYAATSWVSKHVVMLVNSDDDFYEYWYEKLSALNSEEEADG